MEKNSIIKSILVVAVIILLLIVGKKFLIDKNITPAAPDEEDVTGGWKTTTNESLGINFAYPESLGKKYIHTVDWPPKVQIVGTFACTDAGVETDVAGKTETIAVGSALYCVTKVTEGAAGSSYTQYTFMGMGQKGETTKILTFSLKFVQCANFDEVEKNECETERESFDINSTVHRIFRTMSEDSV